MRYIRTKDAKIFDVNKICVPYQVIESWVDFNSQGRFEIIKQADTIEELCDEFVAVHKTLNKTYCIRNVPFKKQDENFNIYGAIWTDKGLIYVAKMNEKGELELL